MSDAQVHDYYGVPLWLMKSYLADLGAQEVADAVMEADGWRAEPRGRRASVRCWMPDIQVEKSISGSAFLLAAAGWIARGSLLPDVEVAQSVGVEHAYLLLGRAEGLLALPQQGYAAFIGIQRVLQRHLAGLHSGDDALQFAEGFFKRGGCR